MTPNLPRADGEEIECLHQHEEEEQEEDKEDEEEEKQQQQTQLQQQGHHDQQHHRNRLKTSEIPKHLKITHHASKLPATPSPPPPAIKEPAMTHVPNLGSISGE